MVAPLTALYEKGEIVLDSSFICCMDGFGLLRLGEELGKAAGELSAQTGFAVVPSEESVGGGACDDF